MFSNSLLAQDLSPPKSYLVQKVFNWTWDNQRYHSPEHYKRQWVTYDNQEIVKKVLNIFQELSPRGQRSTYASLMVLLKLEYELNEELYDSFSKVIERLIVDEEDQELLFTQLNLKRDGDPLTAVLAKSLSIAPEPKYNLKKVFETAKKMILKIPGLGSFENKMTKALNKIEDLLIGRIKDDDCYQNKPTCQYGSNKGVVRYFAERIPKDHELAFANLKLGIIIENLNQAILAPKKPTHKTTAQFDLWPTITQVIGDEKLALMAVSVFGHDVCCNSLTNKKDTTGLTQIISQFRTSKYGHDSDPKSWLYVPGVIAGRHISKRELEKFEKYKKIYDQHHSTKGETFFRAGYHHFHGGILTATALLEDNLAHHFTTDLSTLISEISGFAYKYTQTPKYLSKDAKALWKSIEHTQNIKKLRKPEDWDDQQYLKAKSQLMFRLAIIEYTRAQHVAGAKFAYEVFRRP